MLALRVVGVLRVGQGRGDAHGGDQELGEHGVAVRVDLGRSFVRMFLGN